MTSAFSNASTGMLAVAAIAQREAGNSAMLESSLAQLEKDSHQVAAA